MTPGIGAVPGLVPGVGVPGTGILPGAGMCFVTSPPWGQSWPGMLKATEPHGRGNAGGLEDGGMRERCTVTVLTMVPSFTLQASPK